MFFVSFGQKTRRSKHAVAGRKKQRRHGSNADQCHNTPAIGIAPFTSKCNTIIAASVTCDDRCTDNSNDNTINTAAAAAIIGHATTHVERCIT